MLPAETPAISARDLTKSFGAHGCARGAALLAVDLDILPGKLVALVGPNGSGKTTLLRLLAGDLEPDAGEARVLGVDPVRRNPDLRARVGYLTQSLALDPEMTARESLRLFASLTGLPRKRREARLLEVAGLFGLDEHLRKRVARLSGGLKRRLHLAISFLSDPEVLLLDEPTAGLDADGQKHLWKLLEMRRSSGGCVLVATHDLDAAERHADDVVRLERGRIVKKRPK
jgi:ABC-type multidrug transport system ATPase subunit